MFETSFNSNNKILASIQVIQNWELSISRESRLLFVPTEKKKKKEIIVCHIIDTFYRNLSSQDLANLAKLFKDAFLMNITLSSSIDITKYICFLISEKVGEHRILLGASGRTRIIDTQLYFFNKNHHGQQKHNKNGAM